MHLGICTFLSSRVHVDGFVSSSIEAKNLPSTKFYAVQYVGKTIESFKLGEFS